MNSPKTIHRGRFAPSPTGRMHLGNVYCALLSYLSVKSKGGVWVLRIEDLDPQRSKPDFAKWIEDDLQWLGLDWDEGGSKGGTYAPYYQSQRTDYYASLFEKIGQQTYPCFCRRADLLAASAPHASDGRVLYAGTCRGLSSDEIMHRIVTQMPAYRLCVPHQEVSFVDGLYGYQSIDLQDFYGDFVLRRADGTYAYQLAVAADDAAMHITEVVRGNDLLSSTPAQLYLYKLLGLQAPSFTHVPLLMSSKSGERLSKRDGSLSMEALRLQGVKPEQIWGMLAHKIGLLRQEEPISAKDLIPLFDVNKLPKENITVYSE